MVAGLRRIIQCMYTEVVGECTQKQNNSKRSCKGTPPSLLTWCWSSQRAWRRSVGAPTLQLPRPPPRLGSASLQWLGTAEWVAVLAAWDREPGSLRNGCRLCQRLWRARQ